MKFTTRDSATLVPNPGIETGQVVVVNGRQYRATFASPYQVAFGGQGFHVDGASKSNPVEVEVEFDGASCGIGEEDAELQELKAQLKAIEAEKKAKELEARKASLKEKLEQEKVRLRALLAKAS